MHKKLIQNITRYKINFWIIFYLLIYIVFVIKLIAIKSVDNNIFFLVYSIAVSLYILSRFTIAYFYDPKFDKDQGYEPTITFGIPAKNESKNIRETILKMSKTEYPNDKFDIIVVNDGSTDNTLTEMQIAKIQAQKLGVKVNIIDWKENKGKRAGMVECVRNSNSEIIIFIDSDSYVEPQTARQFVKYFQNLNIAAVSGHTYVENKEENYLTKMQAVRYFIAFRAYKASEAIFGTVTCCSGCNSAYRRSYVLDVLKKWENQTFMGVKCTYGDDRSLTNFLLQKGYQTIYAKDAKAYTFVPNNLKQYLNQQLRWKKSWIRENLRATLFVIKRNPIMSLSFYLGFVLTFLAPIVAIRALIWLPVTSGKNPWFYLSGLLIMSIIYGLYYRIYSNDKKWFMGGVLALFFSLALIWQLPYAILTLRDSRWGTR